MMRTRIQISNDRRRRGLSADPYFRDWAWIKRRGLRFIALLVGAGSIAALTTLARVAFAW